MLRTSRYENLIHWLTLAFSDSNANTAIILHPMTGDAGFRQYYRFTVNERTLIAVDSPPEYCNNQAFIATQQALSLEGIKVPEIVLVDQTLGFFCLSDFGDKLLADALVVNKEEISSHECEFNHVAKLYLKAIALLPQISQAQTPDNAKHTLPLYDRAFIEKELSIFTEWLLDKHLNISLSVEEHQKLDWCFEFLINSALEQPQVTMHRDFHSRNIMMIEDNELGVIDFQDMVIGPITYDIVSLLRDCYTRWPDEVTLPLFEHFCGLMTQQYSLANLSKSQWLRWFDFMGLQRHLKASGIFCRLFYRDNKKGYLKDIPLTLSYIVDISVKYPELQFLHQLMTSKVLPTFNAINVAHYSTKIQPLGSTT